MRHINYNCPKCKGINYSTAQMRATGGIWSKIFDVQTQKYTSVTCDKCKYTEFYKASTSALSNLFDLFS